MKKSLLFITTLALSLSAGAQTTRVISFDGSVQRNTAAPTAAPMLAPVQKASLPSNQKYYGLYSSDALGTSQTSLGLPQYTSGKVSSAILLTPEMLAPFTGMKVVGIRFGLMAKQDSSRVFITPIKDNFIKDDAVSQKVSSTTTGWNNVTLSSTYDITGNDSILVGYDYIQKTTKSGQNYTSACFPMSVVKEGLTGQYLWVYANIPASIGGSGLGWYELNPEGYNLSVQLLIEGNFADYNVLPQDFDKISSPAGKDVTVKIQYFNLSKEPVTDLDYVVTVDGVAGSEQHTTIANPTAANSYGEFSFSVPAGDEDAEKNVSVEITKVNGHDNGATDKTANGIIGVAKNKYARNCVIEEFTTEKCPNCPRVAGFLHTYLETADLTKVFTVCHHSAYYTDWLTQACDNALTSLFNDAGYTYAPAMAFNRQPNFDSQYAQGEMDNVTMPGNVNEIETYVNYELAQLSDLQLTMAAVPNADTTQVTLTINGTCNNAFNKADGLLTVYMTEDNIKAKSQAGASGTFYQQHVIRYFNSNWGDNITWDGNTFTKTYTISVNSAWKKADLKFVAFVNKHNASNVLDNPIYNSIGVPLIDPTTGISNVNANTDSNVKVLERYNAAGQRIGAEQKGLNIVRLANGKTLKYIAK